MYAKITVGLAAAALSVAALAQQSNERPQPNISERVTSNRHDMVLQGGRLRGPGAELLAREMARAQFVMVGEQHATGTIAEVISAMHRDAAAAGFHYAGMEVGPHSTRHTEALIRQGQGRLASYIRAPGNAFSLPFLLWEEEAGLAEQLVALSPARQNALWSLDQEFVGAFPILLPLLEGYARTPAQRSAVADLQSRAATNPLLLAQLDAASLESLRGAFSTSSEGAALVEDIALSNRIYAPFMGRGGSGYESNLARETYLKRNFVRHFERTEREIGRPPRVFLKFGASHGMRGHSLTNVPALANFISEWGVPRGFELLNVFVGCVGGQMSNPLSGENVPCDSSELPDDSPLRTQMSAAPLQLFDLRPLRRAAVELDPKTRAIVLGYDFYLPVRDVRAATLLTRPR